LKYNFISAFFEKTASTQIKKIHGAMINRK
jgi:hypothetical protein